MSHQIHPTIALIVTTHKSHIPCWNDSWIGVVLQLKQGPTVLQLKTVKTHNGFDKRLVQILAVFPIAFSIVSTISSERPVDIGA